MKSLSKQDSKRTLKKRTNSSMKLGRPLTCRTGGEIANILSKSTTIKHMHSRDKITNNYLIDRDKTQKIMKNLQYNGLKKPIHQKITNRNIFEQYLMRNSDKMKLLYWNNADDIISLSKIAISADYILNQDNFWDEKAKGDQQKNLQFHKNKAMQDNHALLVKHWKCLHKGYYIIWIIRKKNSLKKLQQLVINNSLPLHAIFYVKRKKNYTVDYTPIVRQIQKDKQQKEQLIKEDVYSDKVNFQRKNLDNYLNIFEIIKTNTKDTIGYNSFFGRVPVILQKKAKVYFLRVQSEPPGLDHIMRCLQKSASESKQSKTIRYKPLTARAKPFQIQLLLMVSSYIYQYLMTSYQIQKDRQTNIDDQNSFDLSQNQEIIQNKLFSMKKSLIDYFIQEHGRNYQFQGGSSIYNFVGQMFKRNYKILYTSFLQEMQAQRRKQHKVEKGWDRDQISLNLQLQYLQMT